MFVLTKTRIATMVIVLLIVLALAFRYSTIPSRLKITVNLSLNRDADYSNGNIKSFSLEMSGLETKVFENVSLKHPYGTGSSGKLWTLEIVMNDSTRAPITWSYEIIPPETAAGEYAGTVIHSIQVSGQFKLWIILYGVINEARKVADSESELISIF